MDNTNVQTVIGIDCGKKGCLWALSYADSKTIAYYDIEKEGNNICISGIVNFLKNFNPAECSVIIEDPHPHGQDSLKTVFAGFEFGKSIGIIYGIVEALGFISHKVTPPVWKGHFALISSSSTYNEKKAMSVDKACYLSPENESIFREMRIDRRTPRDDRAEAYLLARWGLDRMSGKITNKE